MRARVLGLLPLVGLLYLIGILEGLEVIRQRRRRAERAPAATEADRDPASYRLLALSWPAGLVALAAAACLPGFSVGHGWRRWCLLSGIGLTTLGIALRQWAIATLGRFFVGQVLVQPDQSVISAGPYRWLRHPSYTGYWLEMFGVGLGTGNASSALLCALVPLVGILARIAGEERELSAGLSGYSDFARHRARLVPFVW